nr:MAG TPA: hypothetical protein [Bacteriophage sp.]
MIFNLGSSSTLVLIINAILLFPDNLFVTVSENDG